MQVYALRGKTLQRVLCCPAAHHIGRTCHDPRAVSRYFFCVQSPLPYWTTGRGRKEERLRGAARAGIRFYFSLRAHDGRIARAGRRMTGRHFPHSHISPCCSSRGRHGVEVDNLLMCELGPEFARSHCNAVCMHRIVSLL